MENADITATVSTWINWLEMTHVSTMRNAILHCTMNYFEAVGVFFALMDGKPCWQPLNEVWPEN